MSRPYCATSARAAPPPVIWFERSFLARASAAPGAGVPEPVRAAFLRLDDRS
jgi:hypothetical protein